NKPLVTIKGIREGLLFILDDEAPFSDVLAELTHKLEHTHSHFLTGPIVHVHVKLGAREPAPATKAALREVFAFRGNLLVQSIKSDAGEWAADQLPVQTMKTITGIIRSGQTLHHDGDLLLVGDVNPGGVVTAAGHILVLGSL